MPQGNVELGGQRQDARQPGGAQRKLAAFLGVVAGTYEAHNWSLGGDEDDQQWTGGHLDWDPWIRLLMPEFAVIMTGDRGEKSRVPKAIIATATGEVITLDRSSCHPSDASLLLSGVNVTGLNSLLDATDEALGKVFDGDRLGNARTLLRKLKRACNVGT